MLNYIRAEFYKVLRRRYVWVTLAIVLALEALFALGWVSIHINETKVDFSSGIETLVFLLDVGFYATLLTGDMVFAGQYRHGTLKNEVSFGLSRARVYLGKLLTQTALSVLFCAVMVGFYLVLCAMTQSHDPLSDAEAFRRAGCCFAAAFPLWVGVQAMTCAMMFLIKSETGAVFAALGIVAVLPNVVWLASVLISGSVGHPLGDALMTVYHHMPTVLADNAKEVVGDWTYCGKAWIVGAVWFAAFTAIGLCGFQKKEIK